MVKTKKNFFKVLSTLLVLVVGLSACSLFGGTTGSVKVADGIKKNETALSNFSTGELILSSSISYYESCVEVSEDWIANASSYALTEAELSGVEAWKKISENFVALLPDTTESSTDTVSAAYLGSESSNSSVFGIFVYEFKNGVSITAADAELANTIGEYTEEYFFVKGNYIITVEKDFLSGNGLTYDAVFAAADKAIS